MSINHPDEKTGLLSAPPRTDASVRSAFFVLGAGSTITFNAAVMAVAYFRLAGGLPASVLACMALAQNVTQTSAMLVLTVFTSRTPPMRAYVALLALAAAYLSLIHI